MAAVSATSLHFLSLTPQSLSPSKLNPTLISSSLLSLQSSSSSLTLRIEPSNSLFRSRFVRSVAISQEFEQVDEEEDEDGVSGDEHNFSPKLKLFVGNLPFNVDSAALAGIFERAGDVQMVEVIYDKFTGRSRGFGFVTMSTVEEVQSAAKQFNGYELDGRELRVNSGPPPARRENSSFSRARRSDFNSYDNTNRLHVGNLAWGVDNLALETLFSEEGKVMDAKVVYDRESGRSKGFGFVTYSSAEEVNNAIEKLNGIELSGREIRVSLAESSPKRQF